MPVGFKSDIPDGGWRTLDNGSSQGCFGSGSLADLRTGAPVVVANEAGRTIGTGKLGAGVVRWDEDDGPDDPINDTPLAEVRCVFPFVIAVPAGQKSYMVRVAHAQSTPMSPDQALKTVYLTAGSHPPVV